MYWYGVNNIQLSIANSLAVLKHVTEVPELIDAPRGNFLMLNLDITTIQTLDPFTHVYMFDIGFPPQVFLRIAEIFNASVHPMYLISYRPSTLIIDTYGFEVQVIKKIDSVSMKGTEQISIFIICNTKSD